MKVSEAPEKLYILFNLPYTVDYTKLNERRYDEEVEYTRTDAFIDKVENFLEMLGYGFTITDNITHTNYDKEQLIKDFKNYIERE